MKATIEFNLPEEQPEFEMYSDAGKFLSIITGLSNYLRGKIKYGVNSKEMDTALNQLQSKLQELIEDNHLQKHVA